MISTKSATAKLKCSGYVLRGQKNARPAEYYPLIIVEDNMVVNLRSWLTVTVRKLQNSTISFSKFFLFQNNHNFQNNNSLHNILSSHNVYHWCHVNTVVHRLFANSSHHMRSSHNRCPWMRYLMCLHHSPWSDAKILLIPLEMQSLLVISHFQRKSKPIADGYKGLKLR